MKKTKDLFSAEEYEELTSDDKETIKKIIQHTEVIRKEVSEMVDARRVANKITTEREMALAYHDSVLPHMDVIRYHIDMLELLIDNEIWPLPKYRELLFIR